MTKGHELSSSYYHHYFVVLQAVTGQYMDYTSIAFAEHVANEIVGFTPPPGY